MYKIMLIADIPNWAWGYKSQYIKKYLSDEFKVDIFYTERKKGNKKSQKAGVDFRNDYDLYMNYTPGHIRFLEIKKIDKDRIITGITGFPAFRKFLKGKGSIANRATAIHANSIQFLNLLKKNKNHDRIYYTPNGVDEELFKPSPFPKNNKICIGSVGKPNPEKGLDSYIRPAADKSGSRLLFNNKDWRRADKLVTVAEFYKKIHVYVVASVMDGTPNPALEAAASGRPIISNRIGNMPEFIVNGVNGFLLDKREVKQYVEKINFLSKNRKKMEDMGREARRTVEREWTWKIMAENYRKMFRDVLGK